MDGGKCAAKGKPNREQNEFVEYIRHCVVQNKKEILIVDSPGGTGKTFCIKYLMQHSIMDEKIIILAPTHKAVSLFLNEKMQAQTIHRFLDAKSDYNEEGELIFSFKDQRKINRREYHVIVIDECSMVTKEMYQTFLEYHRDSNSLFIFMGDQCQIPPVHEKFSIVFRQDLRKFVFTQNMRTSFPEIRDICNFFRGSYTEQELHKNVTKIPFEEAISLYCNSAESDSDSVYLTWTNLNKEKVSNIIRNIRFGSRYPDKELDKFIKGESLIFSGYRNTDEEIWYLKDEERPPNLDYIDDKSLAVLSALSQNNCINGKKQKYYSNDYVNIRSISTFSLKLSFIDKTLNMHRIVDNSDVIWCYPCNDSVETLDRFFQNLKNEIKSYKKRQQHAAHEHNENAKKGRAPREQQMPVNVPKKRVESLDMFKYKPRESESPTAEKWVSETSLHGRERYAESSELPEEPVKKRWRNYYFIKRLLYPELDYHYAMTVHKAQGSQWDNVYINLSLLIKSPEKNQLLYTAVSRAKKRLIFTD
jgi:hypothetical protein